MPPDHRSAGAPPASHFIDPLMDHLGRHYYVGLLSAAALHGAAHQSPMAFQVVTDARMRDRRVGRNRLLFLPRAAVAKRPRERRTVPTGRIWLSTVATTVLDLVESPDDGGGLSNVATVLGELLLDQRFEPADLVATVGTYSSTVLQRAGYLIDRLAAELDICVDTESLREKVAAARYRPLDPAQGDGPRDPRWHLIMNADIEIVRHTLLGQELVFRGGTCFHKLWLDRPWRYSEDLDYIRRSASGVGGHVRSKRARPRRLHPLALARQPPLSAEHSHAQFEAAHDADVHPDRVSFVTALRITRRSLS